MKYLFILAFFALVVPASGQKFSRSGGGEYTNTVYLKTAVLNNSAYNTIAWVPLTVEYDRRLTGNLSWVAGFSFTPRSTRGSFKTDVVETRYSSYSLSAKLAMTANRHRRVFFRFEAGFAGVFADVAEKAEEGIIDRFFPSLVVELHMGIRLGRNIELLVSPLLVTPSMFRFSPRRIGGKGSSMYYEHNLAPVALAIRF